MKRCILLLTLLAHPVLADDGPSTEMGRPGHLVIDGNFAVNFGYVSTSPPMGSSSSSTVFTVAPSLDYFVAPGISVGGAVSVQHTSTGVSDTAGDSITSTIYGIGPRVGYHAPIGPQLSFWPRAEVLYAHESVHIGGGTPDVSATLITLVVSAPLLYHPVPHFFVGLGPEIRVDVSSSTNAGGADTDGIKQTQLALVSTIGGWF